MSNSVTKLKELLFEREAETLVVLARRVEALTQSNADLRRELLQAIEAVKSSGSEGHAHLLGRIEALHARTGDADLLTRSVADVLDRAFVDAERQRHDALAGAVAPVVVRTVKTEIHNSRDDLVQALYPMTGQMVKAYVASAMRDLVNEVNRRLENNALMLRLKSLTTGRSVAELALADSQRLSVDEVLLIDRGSGTLVARWPQSDDGGNHDQVLSGVLTAINSFATEALQGDETNLRQIDLGSSQVYLRGSPSYLLAARCSGTAHAAVERILDEEFLATVERLGRIERAQLKDTAPGEVETAASAIGERIARKHAELDAPAFGISPVKLLVWLIGVPLLAWLGWTTWVATETRRVQATAAEIVATSAEIKGYPNTIDVSARGRVVRLNGLAPSDDASRSVTARLRAALPGSRIDNQLVVLPNAGEDDGRRISELARELDRVRADVPRQLAARALARAAEQLAAAPGHIERLEAAARRLSPAPGRAGLASAAAAVSASQGALSAASRELAASVPDEPGGRRLLQMLDAKSNALANARARLWRDLGGPGADTGAANTAALNSKSYIDAADAIANEAQALNTVAIALMQGVAARAAIPPPAPPPPPVQVVAQPPAPTALDRLSAFVRTNAIFFADDVAYRDPAAAAAVVDDLVRLLGETQALIRIVGYTDERGSYGRNASLSQARADTVRAELIARGVPQSRLVAIGRQAARDISPLAGTASPNRRVEFEIGFKGEAAR